MVIGEKVFRQTTDRNIFCLTTFVAKYSHFKLHLQDFQDGPGGQKGPHLYDLLPSKELFFKEF